MKASPGTVTIPGWEPMVVQTWFVSVAFSYPGPDGTSVVHVPLTVWNSLTIKDSNA